MSIYVSLSRHLTRASNGLAKLSLVLPNPGKTTAIFASRCGRRYISKKHEHSEMKKYLLLGSLILASFKSYADCSESNCTSLINQIMITGTEIRIRPAELTSEVAKLDCVPRDNLYLILPETPNTDRMYSTILAAQKTKHPITLRITNSSNPCKIAYIRSYAE